MILQGFAVLRSATTVLQKGQVRISNMLNSGYWFVLLSYIDLMEYTQASVCVFSVLSVSVCQL